MHSIWVNYVKRPKIVNAVLLNDSNGWNIVNYNINYALIPKEDLWII